MKGLLQTSSPPGPSDSYRISVLIIKARCANDSLFLLPSDTLNLVHPSMDVNHRWMIAQAYDPSCNFTMPAEVKEGEHSKPHVRGCGRRWRLYDLAK